MGAGRSSWHVLPVAIGKQEVDPCVCQGPCLMETELTTLCSVQEPLPTGQSGKVCYRVLWFSTTVQVPSAFPSASETASSSSLTAYKWKRRNPSAPSLSSHRGAHCSSALHIMALCRQGKRCSWGGFIHPSGKGDGTGQSVRRLVWQGAASWSLVIMEEMSISDSGRSPSLLAMIILFFPLFPSSKTSIAHWVSCYFRSILLFPKCRTMSMTCKCPVWNYSTSDLHSNSTSTTHLFQLHSWFNVIFSPW